MDDKLKFNIKETRNLEECMIWVEDHMSSGPEGEDHLNKWVEQEEGEALVEAHHGYGTFIRNTLELWYDGPSVEWFNEKGIYHADDMSSIILTSLHRKENGKDIKLDEQIQEYRAYWEKTDPKVNQMGNKT